MKLPTGKYLMVLVSMCGLIAVSLGLLVNVSGLFFAPIAEELGVGRGEVSMTLTIANLVYAVTGLLVGRILSPKTFKPMILAGVTLMVAGTALLPLFPSLPGLYLLNAVRGFGAGLFGVVLVTTVINSWFASGTALMTSIAMGFSGIAAAILSPILSSVIAAGGWRAGYLVSAVLAAVLCLPAILMPIKLTPEDAGLVPYGADDARTDGADAAKAGGAAKTGGSVAGAKSSALPTAIVFVLVSIYSIASSMGSVLPQHFPGMSESYLMPAAVGAGMLSVAMACNTLGKLGLGVLIDTLGTMRSSLLYGVAVLLGVLGVAFVHNAAALYVCAGLIGLSYGMATVSIVSVTCESFGVEGYTTYYPRVNLIVTATNAIGTVLVGAIYDGLGSYLVALIMTAVLLAAGLVSLVTVYRSR